MGRRSGETTWTSADIQESVDYTEFRSFKCAATQCFGASIADFIVDKTSAAAAVRSDANATQLDRLIALVEACSVKLFVNNVVKARFPVMYRMCLQSLGVPTSSAYVERLFSTFNNVLTCRRTSTKRHIIEVQTLLRHCRVWRKQSEALNENEQLH